MTSTHEFETLLEQVLPNVNLGVGEVIGGTVTDITNDFVTVYVGLKSEGLISTAEFKSPSGELKVNIGDHVDVMIEVVENGQGEIFLSYEKAVRNAAWLQLAVSFENGDTVTGEIIDRVKGGFTVDLANLRAFLPGSLADVRPLKDPSSLESQSLQFKIVKMDKKRSNIVVSRRAVLEEESSEEREQLLATLQEGQEISGVVKNLTEYGAFVDLGGIDGLLHITDMSWKRVKHPSAVVNVGDEITVKVLSYDREKRRVSLGMKQLAGDPWVNIEDRHPIGHRLFGTVSNVTDYGCFVEVEDGIEGLVHMSEMDWCNKNVHPNTLVNVGDEVEVMVLEIDAKRRRISLGIKQCIPNPWSSFSENNEVGSTIKGTIKSITDFGIFIGLEGGIDGLIHFSDISWNVPGETAIRNYKKGEEVRAKILTIDSERERISLGIKQLEDDPYLTFLDDCDPSQPIQGKITSKDDKRLLVELDKDIVGSLKNFGDAASMKEGDSVNVYVITTERKSVYIPLSLTPSSCMTQSSIDDAEVTTPEKMSIGGLIKDQLDK